MRHHCIYGQNVISSKGFSVPYEVVLPTSTATSRPGAAQRHGAQVALHGSCVTETSLLAKKVDMEILYSSFARTVSESTVGSPTILSSSGYAHLARLVFGVENAKLAYDPRQQTIGH